MPPVIVPMRAPEKIILFASNFSVTLTFEALIVVRTFEASLTSKPLLPVNCKEPFVALVLGSTNSIVEENNYRHCLN